MRGGGRWAVRLPDDFMLVADTDESDHRSDDGLLAGQDGAAFILDGPIDLESRWGSGSSVLWACGESAMIAAPTGVGKTTLTGQIVRGLVGLDAEVLGLPVLPANRVLHLAMDRPRQIRRSMRRQFAEHERDVLVERVWIRSGPLPRDLGRDPEQLYVLAQVHGCDVVIVDSLKDAVVKLSDDETGGNVNRAIQICNANGIDVLVLHHQRKGDGSSKPNTIADVYGSTWLTAGCGSVILLWGEPGGEQCELRHLKQPADPVGPWHVEHDHVEGTTKIIRGFDVVSFLRKRPDGVTIAEVAQAEHGTPVKSGGKEHKRTERRLRRLVSDGRARVDGQDTSSGQFAAARYFYVDESTFVPPTVDSPVDEEY